MNDSERFVPAEITVRAGETLVFVNSGAEPHTVTAYEQRIPDGAEFFSSGDFTSEEQARGTPSPAFITAGDSFELTLDTPGTYRYFCIPHEQQGMKGTITVEG